MLVSECITRVRVISGDTTAAQFTNDQVLSWINDGIRECAVNNNLLQKDASSNTVVGQASYALPTDILKLHSVKYDNNVLQMITMEEFDKRYSGIGTSTTNATGIPVVGYVWAGVLRVYPTPEAVKALVVSYLYDPAIITDVGDEITLPVGYHSRIVDYCLSQVALQDDDLNKYNLFYNQFLTGIRELKDQPEWDNDLYPSMTISPRDMGNELYYGELY